MKSNTFFGYHCEISLLRKTRVQVVSGRGNMLDLHRLESDETLTTVIRTNCQGNKRVAKEEALEGQGGVILHPAGHLWRELHRQAARLQPTQGTSTF